MSQSLKHEMKSRSIDLVDSFDLYFQISLKYPRTVIVGPSSLYVLVVYNSFV